MTKVKLLTLLLLLFFSSASLADNKEKEDNVENNTTPIEHESSRPWWIGDLLTVVSILTGFGIIVFQLSRQHANDIAAQKENNRDELRLEIYEKFSQALDDANEKTTGAGMYAFNLAANLSIYKDQVDAGFNPSPLRCRAKEFSDLHFTSNGSIIKLITLIEKYEIVSPELEIFKIALNVASHDISEAHTPLFQFLLRILPMEVIDVNGNIQVANILTPTEEQMQELTQLTNAYKNSQDDLGGYLYDFNIELQKLFLGYLFNNEVKVRAPIDPNVKVVTTEPGEMARLRQYFEEETPWGIHKREIEEEVRNNHETP